MKDSHRAVTGHEVPRPPAPDATAWAFGRVRVHNLGHADADKSGGANDGRAIPALAGGGGPIADRGGTAGLRRP